MSSGWSQVDYPSQSYNTYNDNKPSWLSESIDEAELPYSEQNKKDALIFLLDVSKSMRIKVKDNELYKQSVKQEYNDNKHSDELLYVMFNMISNAIRNKIFQSTDDLVSIVLFGSEKANNINNHSNVYVLSELNVPNTQLIKQLNALITTDMFDNDIGSGEYVSVDLALWTSSYIFNNKQSQLRNASKRILILTNNDYPIDTRDTQSRTRTIQKSRDLQENNVEIEIIPFLHDPSVQYDPSRLAVFIENPAFYYDSQSPEIQGKIITFGNRTQSNIQDLSHTVNQKIYKKRALGTIPWDVTNNVTVSVKVYALYREIKRESPILLDKRSNQPLITETKYVDADTGEYVNTKTQTYKYIDYAGEHVYFTDDEIKQIKNISNVGLKLMGFKPKHILKDEYNIRSSYFIYPTEQLYKNSIVTFNALLQSMDKLGQIAICRFVYRKTSQPRFVALLPQSEIIKDNVQIQYPGMHLIFLPYTDDIRELEIPPQSIANDEQISKARVVVDKMTNITEFPTVDNPLLARHNTVVQAIALEEELQDVNDDTVPDTSGMMKHYDAIRDYRVACFGDDIVSSAVTKKKATSRSGSSATKVKRERDDNDDGTTSSQRGHKKTKVKKEPGTGDNNDDDVYNSIDWAAEARNGKLEKRTVAILKLYCQHNHLPVSGKKADLVDRILEHLAQ